MQKPVIFVKKKIKINKLNIKHIVKLEIIVIMQGNIELLRIANAIKILVYLKQLLSLFIMDHFIIKELAETFEQQFTCLGENTEKYINFSVPIEKGVTRIDKNGKGSYRLKFIHMGRFMGSLLSKHANNLAEGIHRIKCKYEHSNIGN